MKKVRLKEIDVLYFLGILLVLIGHSHSSDWSQFENTILERIIYFIYMFHMPLFFFISGFLFQNSNRLEKEGYRKWIANKALRLLTPYFFWSLLAVLPKYYIERGSFEGVGKAILDNFINPRASVWGHFWFLPVLFLTYVLFGTAKMIIKSKGLFLYSSWLSTLIIYFLPIRTQVFGLSDLRGLLIFFTIGVVVRNVIPKQLGWNKVTLSVYGVIATGISIVIYNYYGNKNIITGLIVAVLMVAVCWIVATIIDENEIITWVSSHNFTMYIFSWFFQSVVMVICGRIGYHWILTFFVMFAAGVVGPVLVIMIYEKLPFLHIRFVNLICGMK